MESSQFHEGMYVVAKQGTNPWWPSKVARCKKNNKCVEEVDMNVMVYVNFLEINIEAWINAQNILRVSNKCKMELFLKSKLSLDGENMKYINNVPPTMQESYDKAWNKYNISAKQRSCDDFLDNDVEMVDMNDDLSPKVVTQEGCSPCELCVSNEIEFSFGEINKRILNLSIIDRSLFFSKIIIGAGESVFQCDNQCAWKYHSRCVTSIDDLVCGCNKSSWSCSVCNEVIPVAQLFLCNNYECMRAYHKSCLSSHLELQPDTKQCPLHSCINCRLDDLTSIANDVVTSPLAYCVKCKLAFHLRRDCLPLSYVNITDRYIVCGRHFADMDCLEGNNARLCFTCGSTVVEQANSCKFCLVSYHKTADCLPAWIDLIDERHFICNGCKFPMARRWQYPVLALRDGCTDSSVKSWHIGVPLAPSNDCRAVTIRYSHSKSEHAVSLSRLIPFNLQSVDHLRCFGHRRFYDMQSLIFQLSSLISQVATALNLSHSYSTRNSFILKYSALFPITENIYQHIPSQRITGDQDSVKCVCTNYCSTSMCANVAKMAECTDWNCSLPERCRNRRIQRRQYPRHKLIIDSDGGCYVVLEEAVVKDVLVMELVGEVQRMTLSNTLGDKKQLSGGGGGVYAFSDSEVLDNGRLCGVSRFVRHNESPNLVSKGWTVAGLRRIGLYSCRRIARNEMLTVDMGTVLLDGGTDGGSRGIVSELNSWTDAGDPDKAERRQTPVESLSATVIDLCDNDSDKYGEESEDAVDSSCLVSRRPLCPLCLRELVSDYAKSRAMIHCVNCYTVHHLQCCYEALTASRRQCRIEKDPRLMRFVCHLCREFDG